MPQFQAGERVVHKADMNGQIMCVIGFEDGKVECEWVVKGVRKAAKYDTAVLQKYEAGEVSSGPMEQTKLPDW